jgi:hypothetical protein
MSDVELSTINMSNMQKCNEVAVFISSLDSLLKSNSDATMVDSSLQKICEYILTIDFDAECGAMSLDIKDETFYWFKILLTKNQESTADVNTRQSRKLAGYLNIILERFRKYALLQEKGFLPDQLKSEFFKRNGGETIANKNIYDLIMNKKRQEAEALSAKYEGLFNDFGGRKSKRGYNKKRGSKKRASKKRGSKKLGSKKRASKKHS